MILQALTRYYEDLLKQEKVATQGWGPVKVSYALCLDCNGKIEQIVPIMKEEQKNKKTVMVPQIMILPAAVGKTSGVYSNFLWENSNYFLGIDQKGKPERSKLCFQTAAELHHKILEGIESTVAKAILSFFDSWDVDNAANSAVIVEQYNDITAGGNIVFRVDGCYAHNDPDIKNAWQKYFDNTKKDAVYMQCLITGKKDEVIATHPMIKGVRDAQSSGAALVSFNAPAFCSYGHEQNYNAPIGKYSAVAYTTALNYLLEDKSNVQHIGDTTIVCWAEGAETNYQEFAIQAFFGEKKNTINENDLRAYIKKIANGLPCDERGIDPNRKFYILGIAPNAGRLSVRFFFCNNFGTLMKNVNDHYQRLEISGSHSSEDGMIPMWELLNETVNTKSKDKAASPIMAGAVMRAIFSGNVYPAALIEAIMLRIRADKEISWRRAAIIKAYYLKNQQLNFDKEALTVGLNENCTDSAYLLGRLFALYEKVQEKANPGINTTIKDKYINSAAAMPANIFPILNNLYQKHLRKMDNNGLRIFYDKQVGTIKNLLGESYPIRMNLAQQGAFDLGYYHQKQKLFEKKEDK